MKNFHIALDKRITLEQLFDLKITQSPELDPRSINDFKMSKSRFVSYYLEKGKKYISEITYMENLEAKTH